ncbi:hypothetical protein AArcSl_2673 [Halalkaliarchaeum desulfuricum]|uniref:Uncharacterized protein n=1 Tax=Halalkaliarchaeum desulfuricum TaxID=2055893 RepID=A0A343TMG9_9EURY|nr:hypothetical protein [Halalkaliarchaeum desulfuricum]AUX10291.1 hypothetical protein AArcSl_2673 [Halalkaliarchaeum desulfuricum]
MADFSSRTVARLSKPEYTGENRCLPCTIVNLAIAAVLALIAAVIQPALGVAVAVVSVGAIYLRGYLVPGTPALTKQFLPVRVLRWFGKETTTPETFGSSIDIGGTLLSAGVLVEDPETMDFVLESEFAAAWISRARLYADADTDEALLAAFLEIDEDDLEGRELGFEWRGLAFVAHLGNERIGRWESRSAFVADMAGADVFARRWDGWNAVPVAHRGELLGGLRLFLDTCPRCDGAVSLDQRVVESCCRSYDVVAATCDGCGDRLFEADVPPGVAEASQPTQ